MLTPNSHPNLKEHEPIKTTAGSSGKIGAAESQKGTMYSIRWDERGKGKAKRLMCKTVSHLKPGGEAGNVDNSRKTLYRMDKEEYGMRKRCQEGRVCVCEMIRGKDPV